MVLHVVKTKKKQMAKRVKAARRAARMGKAKLFPVPKTDVHPVIGLTSLGSQTSQTFKSNRVLSIEFVY